MMTLSDVQLLRLFEQFLTLGKAAWKTGSYNQQDPTAYKKADVWFLFEDYDPISKEQGDCFYHVFYHDVTWGVTIRVRDEEGKEMWEAYLDYQDGKWSRISQRGVIVNSGLLQIAALKVFCEFLLDCMTSGELRTKKPDREDEELAYEAEAQARSAERDAGWDPHP